MNNKERRTMTASTISRIVSTIGMILLVGFLLIFMLMLGFLLGSSGLSWVGAIIIAGMLGFVLWRILK